MPTNPSKTADTIKPGPGASKPPGGSPTLTWSKPRLVVHGDLRELTMGPTPGGGESANPLTLRA